MELIINKLNDLKATPSDINEHLDTLIEYTKQCNHVTEFGVRDVVSTWALILHPKRIISYDIKYHVNIEELKNLTKLYNIDYTFNEADVLKIQIEPTEMLFIDTLHRYNQLIMELSIHSKNVNRYIVMHDTANFSFKDENMYDSASEIVKLQQPEKQGLKRAYLDFLRSDVGKDWDVDMEYTNNNGLTILKRIN